MNRFPSESWENYPSEEARELREAAEEAKADIIRDDVSVRKDSI